MLFKCQNAINVWNFGKEVKDVKSLEFIGFLSVCAIVYIATESKNRLYIRLIWAPHLYETPDQL